jgi:hypothetical protein
MPEITKIVFLQYPKFNIKLVGHKWYNIYLYDNGDITVSWGVNNTTYGTRTKKDAGERDFYKRIETKIYKGYAIREIR